MKARWNSENGIIHEVKHRISYSCTKRIREPLSCVYPCKNWATPEQRGEIYSSWFSLSKKKRKTILTIKSLSLCRSFDKFHPRLLLSYLINNHDNILISHFRRVPHSRCTLGSHLISCKDCVIQKLHRVNVSLS